MKMARDENISTAGTLPEGVKQGKNSWGKTGYGGPCPPSGTHRYFFRIFALDTKPDLPPGAAKNKLLKTMEGHVLDKGQLMGRFSK
ncbi:MAG: YbhB/YbcL family Raf kinase inhibitor-like protein [Spirochaetales bacterium]|nr:YbhB/YbcL family Raf kinase inhibitor-like protein [Spirochaetales bacterium]